MKFEPERLAPQLHTVLKTVSVTIDTVKKRSNDSILLVIERF